ncbi:SDR family oxidoreductase [Radiobacillus deserti]|uniref:SDR family NAD(P)-dependent oxidoreductase n=1 Tax=Radiobacillus deserti TaxID=2594883 RepID=A0A516KC82_9BACI|nr:SDR family NAD(P)-dependent oxidoreductase [Radiobacillus deserti]QDP39015.1 SDR family NAD(P)-dependent oxidoreductase [Radiobacillus deserti]
MNKSGNTVLITGGASGIGFALAERFLNDQNEVIIIGRKEEKLKEAKNKHPQLHTKVCDVAKEEERLALFEWVTVHYPDMNILVNNAGIQQRVNLQKMNEDWEAYQKEIQINVEGPIHLSSLFLQHLVKQEQAAIINVSSGLALMPGVWVPIYSATKAAIHSFTVSLRIQLEKSNIDVYEILPPAVNTDLGGQGLHTFGAPLHDFTDSVYERYLKGEETIGYGDSEGRLDRSVRELEESSKKVWENYIKNNPNF